MTMLPLLVMRTIPILFRDEMVLRLLDGSKTQTRRLNGLEQVNESPNDYRDPNPKRVHYQLLSFRFAMGIHQYPMAQEGDHLWVREATELHANAAGMRIDYRADRSTRQIPVDEVDIFPPDDNGWRPSILMPKCACRIELEVTSVRCHRIQDITGEDAKAEGIVLDRCGCEVCAKSSAMCPADASEHVMAFAKLWDSINGKKMPWRRNPWVFAYTFKVL